MDGVSPEDSGADGVESPDPHAGGLGDEKIADAIPHLFGRLVREGHGHDAAWIDSVMFDQSRDTTGEHASLAGARAREHQERTLEMLHCLALLGIEQLQIVLRP